MSSNGKSQTTLAVGDRVTWVRGAVGLTGVVHDFLDLPLAEKGCRVLIAVRTADGAIVHEYPRNLEVRARFSG